MPPRAPASMTRRQLLQMASGLATTGLGGQTVAMVLQPPGPTTPPAPAAAPQTRPVATRRLEAPVVIASANGLEAARRAAERIRQGVDPVDAVVQGVNLVEDDPDDNSVGLGGIPNEEGVVELDAAVMHGPTHKAGAVAALQRIRNPSSVALLVMRRTDHVLLVGEGALRFARAHGFREEDLLTDKARRLWLKWKESLSDQDDWLPPETDAGADHGTPETPGAGGRSPGGRTAARRLPEPPHGTIHCSALTPAGDLACCTSTSGLAFKIPGRVGDSPIIGAGLYCDNDVGSAGSTGRGEANLQNCSALLVVELMRAGRTPEEACLEVLRRIAARTEKRLRNAAGVPDFPLRLYALRKDGMFGGASMRGQPDDERMAVCDAAGARHVPLRVLYPEA